MPTPHEVLCEKRVSMLRASHAQTSSAQAGDGPNPDHDQRVVDLCDSHEKLRAMLTGLHSYIDSICLGGNDAD